MGIFGAGRGSDASIALLFSVLGTEERVALFTLGLVLVEELVEAVEVLAGGAVHVVPPVADEVLLVEDGAVRAEEGVEVAVSLAHVEDLKERTHLLLLVVRGNSHITMV